MANKRGKRANNPDLLIVFDRRNVEAKAIAKRFGDFSSRTPKLVLVLGGDGTMLHAIRRHWRKGLPFLGVNLGHRGFLMNDIKDTFFSAKFFRQKFISRISPLLQVEVTYPSGKRRQAFAFNDANVQAELGKTGWFELKVDDEMRIPQLVGDGVLVATAAGSTAYARSMGANPVPVGTDLLIVVGSNIVEPQGWRSGANLPIDSVVEFRSRDGSGWRKIHGFTDGVGLGEVVGMKVHASRSAAVKLLFTPDHDLRKKLVTSQFPA